MALIRPQGLYMTEITEIDRQHIELIDTLNDLYESMKIGGSAQKIEGIISFLLRYGKEHMDSEEELFEEARYPGKELHSREHSFFKSKVEEFSAKYHSGEKGLAQNLLSFLRTWIVEHISEEDRKFGEYYHRTQNILS
jgi:hemerythrin-like metal-binding protein